MKIFSLIFLLVCLFSLNVFSKILIISDIDDTLKVTNARNTPGLIINYKTKAQFTGMSSLYQLLKQDYQNELVINYVTGTPDSILGSEAAMKSHMEFLKIHLFPSGPVYFRNGIFESNYKRDTITKIVSEVKPNLIILIGDNASKDESIYFNLRKDFQTKGIKTYSLIHRIHANKIDANQNEYAKTTFSYLTSIEIAAFLNKENILSADSFGRFKKEKLQQIILEKSNDVKKDKEIAFPKFLDCVDYKWTLDLSPDLFLLKSTIDKKCKK